MLKLINKLLFLTLITFPLSGYAAEGAAAADESWGVIPKRKLRSEEMPLVVYQPEDERPLDPRGTTEQLLALQTIYQASPEEPGVPVCIVHTKYGAAVQILHSTGKLSMQVNPNALDRIAAMGLARARDAKQAEK